MNEQNTMLFTRELKYVVGLSIKLPFLKML
jgi:hypothetical protein